MTTQELIKQLRSDAHYLANDEIAFNAVISKRIDLAVDCLKVLETQLIKTEEARQKQGKRLSEERKQKYDQITVIDELKNQLATVTAERDKAVEFIKYLDRNYSSYMSEEEKFSKWRGLGKESKTANKR